jgi:hypothetical protein
MSSCYWLLILREVFPDLFMWDGNVWSAPKFGGSKNTYNKMAHFEVLHSKVSNHKTFKNHLILTHLYSFFPMMSLLRAANIPTWRVNPPLKSCSMALSSTPPLVDNSSLNICVSSFTSKDSNFDSRSCASFWLLLSYWTQQQTVWQQHSRTILG